MERLGTDEELVRISEYEYRNRRGKTVYKCVGCGKIISFDEFEGEKGYCADCRDGKKDWLYRARKNG